MIDAHAHLTDRRFASDTEAVLQRAGRAGVLRILSAGEDLASSAAAVALARLHREVRAAVGVHPHRASSWDERTAVELSALALDDHVVAIGEIGLDFSGRSAPREAQERAFREQLALALRLALPVVVHVRDAGERVRDLIAEVEGARGMVHCYSEGPAEVPLWTALGFHVSFAGTVTYPDAKALRAAAAVVPAERVLTETDAPYLAPQHVRGRRNEPLYVAATYAVLAHEREMDLGLLIEAVATNARQLFGPRWGT